jgi:hypothetical protein
MKVLKKLSIHDKYIVCTPIGNLKYNLYLILNLISYISFTNLHTLITYLDFYNYKF